MALTSFCLCHSSGPGSVSAGSRPQQYRGGPQGYPQGGQQGYAGQYPGPAQVCLQPLNM